MSEFKRLPKMCTTEPSAILTFKKGGTVKMAMGGALPMSSPKASMASRRPSPDASMGKPMMDENIAKRAMRQRMAKKVRPGQPEMAGAMPAMKKGGSADMAQDKAMVKKAFKQHDKQAHKGGKDTDLSLKKGGMAADCYADGGKVAIQKPAKGISNDTTEMVTSKMHKGNAAMSAYKNGGMAVNPKTPAAGISDDTTKMVSTSGRASMGKFKSGGSVSSKKYPRPHTENISTVPFANTQMRSAATRPNRLGKTGGVSVTKPGGYKEGGQVAIQKPAKGISNDTTEMVTSKMHKGNAATSAYKEGGQVAIQKPAKGISNDTTEMVTSKMHKGNAATSAYKAGGKAKVEC